MTQGMYHSCRVVWVFGAKTIFQHSTNDNCNVISCFEHTHTLTLCLGKGMINWTMRNISEHKYSVLFVLKFHRLLRNTTDNSCILSIASAIRLRLRVCCGGGDYFAYIVCDTRVKVSSFFAGFHFKWVVWVLWPTSLSWTGMAMTTNGSSSCQT